MLARLSPGRTLDAEITRITGITGEALARDGVEKSDLCAALTGVLTCEKPLVVAYNAQFDLGFLYYFLKSCGRADALRGIKMLDALTVYRDRRAYPHRLENAVEAYGVEVKSTHRAIDDARATLAVLLAMEAERDDLARYVNLFGYNPKYGVTGAKIGSVRYAAQAYNAKRPLYEI
jgi:DNA polymerase-3 subunit epsilon